MDWQILLTDKDVSVKDALKQMDRGGEKILFVVGKENFLLGVVTDGNIRRYILSEGKFKDKIAQVYNPNPLFVRDGFIKKEAKDIMVENKIEVLPILDKKNCIVGAINWTNVIEDKLESSFNRIDVPVVIMAGGKGERLDPFTKILPKPLIPMGEKPIIELIIDSFLRHGVKDFYITLNYKGEMVKLYFDALEKNYFIKYIWENDFLGTAGSLKLISKKIKDHFIVSNCDIIVRADYDDLLRFHLQNKYLLTVVGSIQHYKVPYGVINYMKKGRISSIEEKPEFDFTVNTGVYVLSKKVLDFIPERKQFNMTDLIQVLLRHKKNVGVYPVSEKSYVDIGQWEEYRKHLEKFVF
jgi:dTDP-glucose pyrophosphorylase